MNLASSGTKAAAPLLLYIVKITASSRTTKRESGVLGGGGGGVFNLHTVVLFWVKKGEKISLKNSSALF